MTMGKDFFMEEAIRLAKEGATQGEIPVGCVIVNKGEIIATGKNGVERTGDPTSHAELNAIKEAAKKCGKNLSDCELYVTVEPCAMCAGAIVNSKIGKLYIGTEEPKTGCCGTLYNLVEDARLNSNPKVFFGVKKKECEKQMADFFAERRKQ